MIGYKVFILLKPLPDTDPGTRLFFQDGMYFYKTNTEMERWLSQEQVNSDPGLLREITATEFFYHTNI